MIGFLSFLQLFGFLFSLGRQEVGGTWPCRFYDKNPIFGYSLIKKQKQFLQLLKLTKKYHSNQQQKIMSQDYTEVFSVYQKHMEEEENLRENIRTKVKEMEQTSREIITLLQGVHKPKGLSQIPELCDKARSLFDTVQDHYAGLQKLIPVDEFYRYHEHWRYVTQRLIFSVAFIVFLESGKLLAREEAAHYLGISCNPADGFHIELDDFLLGLLLLAEELSRLSLNCATHGDYKKPVQIAEFVSEMNVGFRLLNLKNDLLRRKFDGLKYCLKKVEEVVYDLSIRGLKSDQESESKIA